MENNKLFDALKSKNITESSLKLYFNNLRRLNGGEFPKSFTFLKNVEETLKKIEHYKANTRRTYLISIVTLLKHDPKNKKLYDKYYTILDEYNKQGATNNVKSETQKENWITQDEVKKIYDNLTDEVKPLLEKKKLTQSEYDNVLSWTVLSLYTLQPPRRNIDYQIAVVVNKYLTEMEQKYNYYDLSSATWYFNNYKTKGTYKTQEQKASPELAEVIKKYLAIHPLKAELKKKSGAIPFLVDSKGIPFESNNTITRILNKIFGKRIGVSLLRNIYLTDKYADKVSELDEDAKAMGTSANTIQNQYVKLDGGSVSPENIVLTAVEG
jgi:hypothetical protein